MSTPAVRMVVPSRRAELRLLAGFAVVPPAVGLLAFAGFLVMFYAGNGTVAGGRPVDPLDSALSVAFGIGIVALVMTVFGAVPGVSWLMRRGPLSLRALLLLGATLGNVPLAIIALSATVVQLAGASPMADVSSLWYGARGAAIRIAIGAICGVVAAAVFWVVGVRGTDVASPGVVNPASTGTADPDLGSRR